MFDKWISGPSQKILRKSLDLTKSALAYNCLGNIYLKDKDQKRAIEAYQKGFDVLRSR